MARSPLTGIEPAPEDSAGRDDAALGPSDSSDSGSDIAGRTDRDGDDPNLPIDVALRDDLATRTGGLDAEADGADIGVDRIFSPADPPEGSDADADAALDAATANDPLEDEDVLDDEDAPDEDEREIAAATGGVPRSALPPSPPPPHPAHPNPEPDVPVEDPDAPNDEGDAEVRRAADDQPAAPPPSPPRPRRFVPPRRW